MRGGQIPPAIALGVIAALVGGAITAESSGQEPRVDLKVEPVEATVGDPLTASLEVVVPPEWSVERPEPGAEVGPFSVTALSWEGPEEVEDGKRWIWRGRLVAFETGELELPGLSVRADGPEGEVLLRTDGVEIRVRSVIPPDEEDPDLADLKGPATTPPDYGPLRQALVIVGLLLVASAVAWWLQRRYAHRLAAVPAPEDPFRRMPPHVWVYRELQQLLERRLAEEGQVDLFFSELARILKMYLGGRYRLALLERTTTEVPPLLRQVGVTREAVQATRELLERSDRVKFASYRPAAEACRAGVEEVYRIVDATKPAEAPEDRDRGAA